MRWSQSNRESALGVKSFHTLRGGYDKVDAGFRPRVVGQLCMNRRASDPQIEIYHSRVPRYHHRLPLAP